MVPDLFCNLKHALLPLMDDNLYVTMKSILKQIDDRNNSRKRPVRDNDVILDKSKRLKSEDNEDIADSTDAHVKENSSCTADFCAPCFELA
jgi:hypothetical protein